MDSTAYLPIPRGLEVCDRGQPARECPVCGDLFYRDLFFGEGQCAWAEHPADGYIHHWRVEHRDLRLPDLPLNDWDFN